MSACSRQADTSTVPQVLQTARQLLLRQRVPALQLELTKTNKQSEQTCAAIKMLNHLHEIGFRFKQVRGGLQGFRTHIRTGSHIWIARVPLSECLLDGVMASPIAPEMTSPIASDDVPDCT